MVGRNPKHTRPIIQDTIYHIGEVDGLTRRPVVLATDATGIPVINSTVGVGFIATTGKYGFTAYAHPRGLVGPSQILVAELRAVDWALSYFPERPVTVLCDSSSAVELMMSWLRNDQPGGRFKFPPGYTLERPSGREAGLARLAKLFATSPQLFLPSWIAGHPTDKPPHPLNHTAHLLARLGFGVQQRSLTLLQATIQAEAIARQALKAFRRSSS